MLQFVSQSDNIQSCKFAQTMEQRLQRAFQDAERKVLNTKSNLTIQVSGRVLQPEVDRGHPEPKCWWEVLWFPHFKAAFVLWVYDVGRRRCHFGVTELSQAWHWWGYLELIIQERWCAPVYLLWFGILCLFSLVKLPQVFLIYLFFFNVLYMSGVSYKVNHF